MNKKSLSGVILLWIAATCVLASGSVLADVSLPKLVGDHMVLQRDEPIMLWGWGDPGEAVRVEFQGRHVKVKTDSKGRWKLSLGSFSAGGPYNIVISGKNRIVLRDVLVGDVWLASGQSNMEFPLSRSPTGYMAGVVNAEQEIVDTDYPQLRLFKVQHAVRFRPASDVEADTWAASTAQTAGQFSAVAYLFGRELHKRYHIPVGLIQTSWGGTVAEAWVSPEGLKSLPEFGKDIDTVAHADESSVKIEHDRYMQLKAQWIQQHADEGRGERDGRAVWADPAFDSSAWPTVREPQSKPAEALKGFDGVVWFRRDIEIPCNTTGRTVWVNLFVTGKTDTTYFNGKEIGHAEGWGKPRSYAVPPELIKAGRNVVTVRLTGANGYVGMFDSDNPDKLNLQIGSTRIPLAGQWSYQPDIDLAGYPTPSTLSELLDDPNRATVLFNGMIEPLVQFRIRGVIWYQGESNARDNRAEQYRKLFPALIEDWRRQWGYDVHFLFVQLAGFGHNKRDPAEYPWAVLREAQSMTLALPKTGMASAIDVGDENDIHPRDKQTVAHRLVLSAAKLVYGENIISSGPIYQSMQVEANRVRIKFSNIGSGLMVKDPYGYIRGFQVAGPDGKFHWAEARQDGQDVLLFSDAVSQPAAVRYDWSNTPDGNLFNQEGLPALPFRTDAS